MTTHRCICGQEYRFEPVKAAFPINCSLECVRCGRHFTLIRDVSYDKNTLHSKPLPQKRNWRKPPPIMVVICTLLVGASWVGFHNGFGTPPDEAKRPRPATGVLLKAVALPSETKSLPPVQVLPQHKKLAKKIRHVNKSPLVAALPIVSSSVAQTTPKYVATPAYTRPLPIAFFLPTGTEIAPSQEEAGKGTLTVINGTSQDAAIKLVGAESPRLPSIAYRYIYIRANDQWTMTGIGVGTYRLLFRIGQDWNRAEEIFNRQDNLSRFADLFDYEEPQTRTADGIETHFSRLTVTLHPVINGNARTEPADNTEFTQAK